MSTRVSQELELLRRVFPKLEYSEAGQWVLLPEHPLPAGVWNPGATALAFQIPPGLPGQAPYGFHLRVPVALASGAELKNTTASAEPPFEGEWLKFSWSPAEWRPTTDLQTGSNMLNWVLSFDERLREGA
jgi:hypothetical protein